jgi:hypothetical protein
LILDGAVERETLVVRPHLDRREVGQRLLRDLNGPLLAAGEQHDQSDDDGHCRHRDEYPPEHGVPGSYR